MAGGKLTINLDAIAANWQALNALTAGGVQTAVSIKADAYGLGAERVAKRLFKAGARVFCVALAEEAHVLRAALGLDIEIFVFSGHMSGDTDIIGDLQLTPMLNSVAQLIRHFEALPGHAFGIQLDSGMNRLGMEAEEWAAVRDVALGAGPRLVMSHLACADEPDHPMNAQQLATFEEMTLGVLAPRSLAATGGILLGSEYHFDMVRPGIGLYGGAPYDDAYPVVHLGVPVIQTRNVPTGESVGYGNSWIAERDSVIATISAGYADGLIRSMSNKATLFADGIACPLVGRVSMDLIGVDITDLATEPRQLDFICPEQGVDDLAEITGTIGYEILTSLGGRYARRYYAE